MTDEQYRRDYAQHLIEQVKNGQMTRRQLLVRASVFGFSATVAGSLLAACGGSHRDRRRRRRAPAACRRPVMGGTLKVVIPPPITEHRPGHHLRPGRHRPRLPVQRVPHRPGQQERPEAQARRELVAERRRSTSGPSSCARASRSTTAAPSRPPTWSASIERVLDPKSGSGALAALGGILSPGGTKAIDANTVEFNLDKPFADFPYLVSAVVLQHRHPAAQLRRRLRQEPRRHRPLHAQEYVVEAELHGRQEPHLLGQGRRRQPAPVPGRGRLASGPGRVGRQPAAAVRRRRRPAADGLPGRAGAVRRPQPAGRHLPGDRHPRGRVQRQQGAVEERQGAPPGRRLLPRPRRPSTRRSTTAAATSATTPSGSRRSSRAARPRRRAPRTTPRPSSCSPTAGTPTASTSR